MARPSNSERRKREATELLENETLAELFTETGQLIHDEWDTATSVEKREQCHAEIRALTKIKERIYAAAKQRAKQ